MPLLTPPDYVCYYTAPSGRTFDLAAMCAGQRTAALPSPAKVTVTLAQFNQIKQGQTIAAVAKLLGATGNRIEKRQGALGFLAETYFWENADRSFIAVDFSDGLVVKKVASEDLL